MTGSGWKMTIDAEAEVIPGSLSRIRALCEERSALAEDGSLTDAEQIWPTEILAILDGKQ